MQPDDDEIPDLLDTSQINNSETNQKVKEEEDGKRVPCTLITGFLGAGKSTLLKRILTERHGYRIAVIMNEFADTADIEAKAINISSNSGDTGELTEEFLELANGCLCCSIKDTGIAAIENLMRKKGAFDYILLETTGLADPSPIASSFWHNEEFTEGLGRHMYLDGVVCVLDALFGNDSIDDESSGGLSSRQIAMADVILLNKVDLVPEEKIVSFESRIKTINAAAPIYRTIQGQVDLSKVIGLDAYSTKLPSFSSSKQNTSECESDHHHHHHHHHHHTTHDDVTSMQVSCPPLTRAQAMRLDKWIRTALWEGALLTDKDEIHQPGRLEILRCKGIYSLLSGHQFVLQGVRSMYDISPLTGKELGIPEEGKLVFIGKGLDEVAKQSLLNIVESEKSITSAI